VIAPPSYPVFDLEMTQLDGRPVFDVLSEVAAVRDGMQSVDTFGHHWRPDAHLVGLCGEWVYGCLSDQLDHLNLDREIIGLAATDFPGVDVKSSGRGDWLLANVGNHLKAPLYFALKVDVERRLVRPLGYATRQMMRDGPGRDWSTGHRDGLRTIDLISADVLLARLLARGVVP